MAAVFIKGKHKATEHVSRDVDGRVKSELIVDVGRCTSLGDGWTDVVMWCRASPLHP